MDERLSVAFTLYVLDQRVQLLLIPAQFLVLITWWLYQASTSGEAWWNPLGVFTLGTCLFQWGVVLLIFYLANDRMAAATFRDEAA